MRFRCVLIIVEISILLSESVLGRILDTGLNPDYQSGNFEPQNAHPWARPKCVGPLPDFDIPTLPGNWRIKSLQQLCAHTQFGGLLPNYHNGGFCCAIDRSNDQRPFWRLCFDRTPAAKVVEPLSLRLFRHCTSWCICSAPDTDLPNHLRKNVYVRFLGALHVVESADFNFPSQRAYEFDRPRDFRGHLTLGDGLVTYQSVFIMDDTENMHRITMDHENLIHCNDSWWPGDTPRPNFPTFVDDFRHDVEAVPVMDYPKSINAVCSTGFRDIPGMVINYFNVGGYCHRDIDDPAKRDVAFSDELASGRVLWWDRAGQGLLLKHYCWTICRCRGLTPDNDPPEGRTMEPFWDALLGKLGPNQDPYSGRAYRDDLRSLMDIPYANYNNGP